MVTERASKHVQTRVTSHVTNDATHLFVFCISMCWCRMDWGCLVWQHTWSTVGDVHWLLGVLLHPICGYRCDILGSSYLASIASYHWRYHDNMYPVLNFDGPVTSHCDEYYILELMQNSMSIVIPLPNVIPVRSDLADFSVSKPITAMCLSCLVDVLGPWLVCTEVVPSKCPRSSIVAGSVLPSGHSEDTDMFLDSSKRE